MEKSKHTLIVLPLLLACGNAEKPIEWCEGETAQRYAPASAAVIEQWPDDLWTIQDPQSPTGRSISVSGSPWALGLNDVFATVVPHLEGISGFNTQGHIMLSFTRPLTDVPSGFDVSTETNALQLFDLSTTPLIRPPRIYAHGHGRIIGVLPKNTFVIFFSNI